MARLMVLCGAVGVFLSFPAVAGEQLLDVRIVRDKFHGEWNYAILPEN